MSSKKPKEKQRSIFDVCFPCFSKTSYCDDLAYHSCGKDFTDYDYVLENLAIKRVPKNLLEEAKVYPGKFNKKLMKKSSGHKVKKAPPEISIGPVTRFPATPSGEPANSQACKIYGPCIPTFPADMSTFAADGSADGAKLPGSKNCPCSTNKNYYVETHPKLDDNIIQQLLHPQQTIYEKSSMMQVSADVHETVEEEERFKPVKTSRVTKTIPIEIKETIEALKVAKPHLSEFSPRNRRSLVRTVSTTSCDKETSCNLFDTKYTTDRNFYAKDLESNLYKDEMEHTKKRLSNSMRFKSCSSTSDGMPFPDIIECEEKESCELQTTEHSGISDKPQKGQSLRWKIIINKHKRDKKN